MSERSSNALMRKVGGLPSLTVRGEFLDAFYASLEEGKSEQLVTHWLRGGYGRVYVVLGSLHQARNGRERRLIEAHDEERLEVWEEKLQRMRATIQQGRESKSLKRLYLSKIKSQLRKIALVDQIATTDSTVKQMRDEEWAKVIDVEKSLRGEMVVLPYEQLAWAMLKKYRAQRSVPGISLSRALKIWNLSEAESRRLGDFRNSHTLDEHQGSELFRILLRRLNLHIYWQVKVSKDKHSLEVDSKANTLWYPRGRRLTGEDIRTVTFHELSHVVGGENGKMQHPVMRDGVDGYLETEEGVAGVAEVLGGLPFGNIRQAIMAGRYVAVAMALKARRVKGKLYALHSMQEIYEKLLEYGLSKRWAAKTVWRAFRGTSLTHQAMELSLEIGEVEVRLPVAECFVRDSVYLRGFLKVMGWFDAWRRTRTHTAGHEEERELFLEQMEGQEGIEVLEQAFTRLSHVNRQELVEVIEYLRLGKLPLWLMVGEESMTERLVQRGGRGWVRYGKILEAAG